MAQWRSAVVKGVTAGLIAGIPQVVLTQVETRLLGTPREQADIGPRFVRRVAQRFVGTTPSSSMEWLLATLFHFGYAAQWGALYALVQEWRPIPPLVGSSMLAGLIYTLAFSPWGAATRTGTERPLPRRRTRETLMHWTAALSFSLTAAYVYEWLRRRTSPPDPLRGATIGFADIISGAERGSPAPHPDPLPAEEGAGSRGVP